MGVPVVGTDVGVVPYLARTSEHCVAYHYDTTWHQVDFRGAVDALSALYGAPFTYADRLACRRSVEAHTTERWVERVCALARETVSRGG